MSEPGTEFLGQSIAHESARQHVRGEAIYLGDLPRLRGEFWVDFVGSPHVHGQIRSIDLSGLRALPGIVAYTADDVPGSNAFGPIFQDEELLAKEVCHYLGQPIVVVAGTDKAAVVRARQFVRIEMDPLPAVLTIAEAIERQQFIGPTRRIQRGDLAGALASAEQRCTGELNIGGQEHFYLESQAALAIPGEAGHMTVHSSTQNPTETQAVVAHCLGLGMHQVVCICRRMGGGFGGKETQAALPAALAALVAHKTRRPARMILDCATDFRITGKRHPYFVRFDAGFTNEGRITALKTDFYSNGGFSADLSLAVMERTLLHAENAYFIPDVAFSGTVCRTNLPSNTAFRGFGGPQAVAAMEHVIEEIAARLERDPFDIRKLNCYGIDSRNITPYGQVVRNNTLPLILEDLAKSSDYKGRRQAAKEFNARSRTHSKGIALTPVKFGISFTRRTLNQANALVQIYTDGTVQVSTGGTEMGQGLFTKIQQLVASRFGLPLSAVAVMAVSTEKNNNTSPTAASASTDLNGTAAVRACEILRERLLPIAARLLAHAGSEPPMAEIEFAQGVVFAQRDPARRLPFSRIVAEAYEQRVDLGARGFYATPGVDFDRETGQGAPFFYYTNGAAVAEVLIDRFTGDLRVERIDLLMDLGRCINPAIDRGQVIGGFVQGMGWVTTEALRYGPEGKLWSDSPTTYKVPNVTDVPADFRVAFLDNAGNTENLYGNKAVGEPPLMLAVSVWVAIRQAVAGAGIRSPHLDLPAGNEEILLALSDQRGSHATSEPLAELASLPIS
ncbi:MAG TPA: xanthine dehydrogenase molybdopterin binding subunit [Gemmataceae bacterium]|nr:xanthine dehydrogenase molybdopterin binding subunit [Gemmataceae bacterium]